MPYKRKNKGVLPRYKNRVDKMKEHHNLEFSNVDLGAFSLILLNTINENNFPLKKEFSKVKINKKECSRYTKSTLCGELIYLNFRYQDYNSRMFITLEFLKKAPVAYIAKFILCVYGRQTFLFKDQNNLNAIINERKILRGNTNQHNALIQFVNCFYNSYVSLSAADKLPGILNSIFRYNKSMGIDNAYHAYNQMVGLIMNDVVNTLSKKYVFPESYIEQIKSRINQISILRQTDNKVKIIKKDFLGNLLYLNLVTDVFNQVTNIVPSDAKINFDNRINNDEHTNVINQHSVRDDNFINNILNNFENTFRNENTNNINSNIVNNCDLNKDNLSIIESLANKSTRGFNIDLPIFDTKIDGIQLERPSPIRRNSHELKSRISNSPKSAISKKSMPESYLYLEENFGAKNNFESSFSSGSHYSKRIKK